MQMKLKSKLIISFCIIIFVPLLLAAGVVLGFKNVQIKQLEQAYGVEDYDGMTGTTQLLNRFSTERYQELHELAKKDTEKLMSESYLNEINAHLLEKNSYLILRVGDEIRYCGDLVRFEDVKEALPEYGKGALSEKSGIYVDHKMQSLIRQLDLRQQSEEKVSLFLVTTAAQMLPEVRDIMVQAVIAIILILLSTALMLTVWIYTSIITPIKKLQIAAKNIKEGNLDFTIEVESRDEIGELCLNFEEMRQRLKESAEEKIANERENKVLISNISHDLKTPITAIKGYVEGIMDGVADTPQKRDKYLKTIYNKANEMNILINELTTYSHIDTNRIPYNFNRLDLTAYFNDCVEELGLDLEAKNISLVSVNETEAGVRIIADPEQLSRVIHNIVGNSVKYLDKQEGHIKIRLKDVGDFVQFEIEDNGKGIASKDLPYIFDRFYRADTSRNSATGGSGIGLSIVKKIIEDHGGKIWVTSKESTGTIMYFVLRKYQEASENE